MNKLKRTAALLMAAGLSLSMLAGCGTSGQDSTSASPDAEQNTSEVRRKATRTRSPLYAGATPGPRTF